MRSRMCNACKGWAQVSLWDYGCPSCGHGNGRDVYYSEYPGVEIMPDIGPYRSMADGTIVEGRYRHREHLKRHNAIEIGNDSSLRAPAKGIPDVDPKGRKELIRAQVDAMSHDEFKRAIKRDVDRIKWETRS